MKTLPTIATAVLLSIAGTAALVTAGPLTPPGGPVASTYKTLTEVEPRIAVNATNTPGDAACVYRITQAGSYYLTGNLAGVQGKTTVLITSEGVTLDLNGFTVSSTGGGTTAIRSSGNRTTVRNGVVFGGTDKTVDLSQSGFALAEDLSVFGGTAGIQLYYSSVARNCRVLGVSGAGATGFGIQTGINGQVLDCQVDGATNRGIWTSTSAVIARCAVRSAAGPASIEAGADSSISGCAVTQASSVHGIQLSGQGTISGCSVREAQSGFTLGQGATAENCEASACGGSGFSGAERSVLRGCTASLNAQYGFAVQSGVTLEGCSASGNGAAGFFASSNAAFTACTAYQNTGHGFQSGDYVLFTSCVSRGNGAQGYALANAATLRNCTAETNAGQGIRVASAARVEGCTARDNGQQASCAGIWVTASGGYLADNMLIGNGYGLWVDGTENVIVRNIARGNLSAAYTIPASNDAAPIVASPGSSGFAGMTPWSNIAN